RSPDLALAVVSVAPEHAAALAREELLEVLACDVLELEPELAGQLCHVPQHVPELPGDGGAAFVADDAAFIPDRLLGVLGDLAALRREAERRVGEPRLARVARGTAREALVVGELHPRILGAGPAGVCRAQEPNLRAERHRAADPQTRA